jgi:hypothetical protein
MNVLIFTGNQTVEEFMEQKDIRTGLKDAKERASKIMVYL